MFLILLPHLLSGCGTASMIDRIEHHDGNVEVRVNKESDGKTSLQWQSQPGYTGELLSTSPSCEFSAPQSANLVGSRTIEFEPIGDRFVRLYSPKESDRSAVVTAFRGTQSGEICNYLVYGENHCPPNGFCSNSPTINVLDGTGKSVETFTLPKRDRVPLSSWPAIGAIASVDVIAGAAAAVIVVPVAIIVAPFYAVRSMLNKSPNPKDAEPQTREVVTSPSTDQAVSRTP